MAKKDVFKIDNYFITIGIIFLIGGLITTFADPRTYNDLMVTEDGHSYTFENYNGRSLEEVQQELGADAQISVIEKPFIRPIIGISGVILLVIGIYYRKKENKVHSIWDALEKTKEGKVDNLVVSLGISRSFILENLKHINAQQGVYYVYLADKDMIVDGRLMERHTLTVKCSGCGHTINQKVSLANLEKPTCNYCGAAVPVSDLSNLRNTVLKETPWVVTSPKKEFSVAIFVVLLIAFWPGAIAYMVYKKNLASQKNLDLMTKFSKENLAKAGK